MNHAAPTLTIDLSALVANWRLLAQRFTGGECAAVVKANAYGLGVEAVARALRKAGCKTFFVATLEEGIELRRVLENHATPALSISPSPLSVALSLTLEEGTRENVTAARGGHIYVFHGPYAGEEKEYEAHGLVPVLNSVEQVKRWNNAAPFALHVDTGMNRLGLTLDELKNAQFTMHNAQLLLSHLACGNAPAHPLNAEQLARFSAAKALLPKVPASLCNSSGIFLGADFHFDLARPGCALYGINPTDGANPLRHVATLSAPVIQLRTADRDGSVGYGATHAVKKGAQIAIVQLGYADGYFRCLSNKSSAFVQGQKVPVVGRVSMDMIAVDVSAVPGVTPGSRVELMNAQITVDELARAAGTIGYEVLTGMGRRVKREYAGS